MVDLTALNTQAEAFAAASPTWFYAIVIATVAWKLIWYGLAIYKTIEKKQKAWFVVLFIAAFILNDLGILPIIYLIINKDKSKKSKKKK